MRLLHSARYADAAARRDGIRLSGPLAWPGAANYRRAVVSIAHQARVWEAPGPPAGEWRRAGAAFTPACAGETAIALRAGLLS